MHIHMVIGPPGSGKSTFRKKHFGNQHCLDIWDYQADCDETYKEILKTYVHHRRACIDWLERAQDDPKGMGTTLVVEHTMLRAQRRAYYINRFRKHAPEAELWCWYSDDPGFFGDDVLSVFEYPKFSEGFDRVCRIERYEEQYMRCVHCLRSHVEWSPECPPHSSAHWICPRCDSTYVTEAYPKIQEGELRWAAR